MSAISTRKRLGRAKRQFRKSDTYHSLRETYLRMRVVARSPYDNLYYCTTQKTGSQWFRAIFNDEHFYRYTGLRMVPYEELGLKYAEFSEPFPKYSVATHLYINYPTFQAIPKPKRYKAFFVLRDPRDAVVSWYFSAKKSHKPVGPIPEMRSDLLALDQTQGLKYIIDRLEEFGSFYAQRSWMEATLPANVRVFRYEDFSADNRAFLGELLDYLEVKLPPDEFEALYEAHTFQRHAKGREQGQANEDAHYRKGISGDWLNYFNDEVTAHFKAVTGNTMQVLGYEW